MLIVVVLLRDCGSDKRKYSKYAKQSYRTTSVMAKTQRRAKRPHRFLRLGRIVMQRVKATSAVGAALICPKRDGVKPLLRTVLLENSRRYRSSSVGISSRERYLPMMAILCTSRTETVACVIQKDNV